MLLPPLVTQSSSAVSVTGELMTQSMCSPSQSDPARMSTEHVTRRCTVIHDECSGGILHIISQRLHRNHLSRPLPVACQGAEELPHREAATVLPTGVTPACHHGPCAFRWKSCLCSLTKHIEHPGTLHVSKELYLSTDKFAGLEISNRTKVL